jgi:hypothetical protein
LAEWVILQGEKGLPLTREDLRIHAALIAGKELGEIGRNWHVKFEERHPHIRVAKATKLDPKRVKNFNKAAINDYFDKLEDIHAQFPDGIPPEHIWNMDEKGIQLGGGRKNLGKKFYFLHKQRNKYHIRSDNLELVTILECVSAAGAVVPPSFCLQTGRIPDIRHDLSDDEFGRYVIGPRCACASVCMY